MSANNAREWQHQHERVYEPNRKVVKRKVRVHKKWITTGEKFMYCIFAVTAIIACLYIITFSSQTDQLNRQVQKLESNVETQETNVANLNYKVKELSQPDRIVSFAKEHGLKIKNTRVKQASEISMN
ncbi:cell division protein FtsL [Saliterribacillus persicus]|uniref:Cell division protein FtsL n=1 Tax=Saliterribacillus persicus TaxID=930114 RepID=A0A368XWB0_9BACI|nr:cell division protein FtsL [Saliterribacillus persicus]RCW70807.1 cell division protein FtsL [Saliterribacillus persicus]